MNYILDTQILIWFQLNSSRLPQNILDILTDFENVIYISDISLFEISIKQKIGKLPEFDEPIGEILNLIRSDGFIILPIESSHIAAYEQIPLIENHKDPFDRLLLATSLNENITIISADEIFKNYTDQISIILI